MQENDCNQILQWIDEDKDEIISFLSGLIQCKTPSTVGDTREAVSLIKNFLKRESISFEEYAYCKTMPNIVSTFAGSAKGRHFMFNGHMDTMPAGKEKGWIDSPYSGAVHHGRVWGRGASDMKAGDTAMLFAYKYLYRLRDRLSGRLSISLAADEETGMGRGTGFLFNTLPDIMKADCVLAGEPSEVGAISFASKGFMTVVGKAYARGAIAGYSNASGNAAETACDVIRDLKELENIEVRLPDEMEQLFRDEKWTAQYTKVRSAAELEQLRKITVDVCTIKGGSMSVMIPADCIFTVSIVFPQGTNVDDLTQRVKRIEDRYSEVTLGIEGVDPPDYSDPNGELPALIRGAARKIGMAEPVMTPDIAISDCRYWRRLGIPAYWYGPGGSDCGAANESVLTEDLLNTVRVHAITAYEYLKR